MGRLSEFFRYLKVDPQHLQDFKKETAYIYIDKNKDIYKPIRRKYLKENIDK